MKTYEAPRLIPYGTVAHVTAYAGAPGTGDVLVDVNGTVIATDALSGADFCQVMGSNGTPVLYPIETCPLNP
ncbi:MAG: hypothetical protein ABJF88_00200 [Rhodothermales bacterium]